MGFEWIDHQRFKQDPRDPAFYQNPYWVYHQLHERGGPVFWEDYGLWCLAGFDAVDRCLRDKRFARLPPPNQARKTYPPHLSEFARSEAFSLLALEPPEHTRLRKLVQRAFVSRRVERMEEEILRLAHQCIDAFEPDGHAELLAQYATPIPVTVIARLLGVPDDLTDDLLRWSHAMVKVYTLTQSIDDEVAADKAASDFMHCIENLITEKRRSPKDDLLSHLVSQQRDRDGPTDHEIVCVSILLLNAGHEATVHQLGNSIVQMLLSSRLRSGWHASRASATADVIVEECLRYDAPLHLFTRFAQEPVKLSDGVVLQAGDELALLLGAANRCPAKFQDPESFLLNREGGHHVSFGAGLHFCVGASLAKLELRVGLGVLFERLPQLRLAGTPVYRDSFHFHGYDSIDVVW